MSKRQIRISDPDEIKKRMPEFINTHVNIVLPDNTVIMGKLINTSKNTITLQNMRLKKMMFPTEKVMEFFADVDA